jgi:hypothetical protein
MRRARERGFALLLVFAMAAAVAILLYTEMPRVVFEAQRVREQTLIDRGEQYQRAIQLYVRKIQRYPARIEDLESTNNIRFLRRRYPDPMTGKDDWRLVHVGPGGILLDSKVQKLQSPDKDKEKKPENTFITEAAPVGSTGVGQPGAGVPSMALLRRASDRAPVSATSMPGAQGGGAGPVDPDAPQQFSPGYPTAPPAPGQSNPYFPGAQPGQYPGMQQGQYPGVQPGQYPGMQPGQYPGMPAQGQIVPFMQPGNQVSQYPNQPASSQTGGQVPIPFPAYAQQPGAAPGAANPNPALELIRNLLTSPRQGPPIGGPMPGGGMQLGGGIAGVASKYEAEGIKVYNEKTAYQEWEFIYDPKNDRALGGGMGMGGIMPGMQGMQGQMGTGQQQGAFGQGQGTGFGTQPTPQQPGFGFPPQTQPGFGPQPSPGRGR